MLIPHVKPITNKRLEQLERNSGSFKYQLWRKKVLARDQNKCQYPACKSIQDLEIHHIRRFVDAKHLRHETYNGITLCKKHHLMVTSRERSYELSFFVIAIANEKAHKKRLNDPNNEHTGGHAGTEPA